MDDLGAAVQTEFEGRFLVYKYLECDREDEGSTVNLYRISQGKAERLIAPQRTTDPGALRYTNDEVYQAVLKRLLKAKTTTVYAPVYHREPFFGITPGFTDLRPDDHGPEGDEVQEWCELSTLCEEDDIVRSLTDLGITVTFYDAEEKKAL